MRKQAGPSATVVSSEKDFKKFSSVEYDVAVVGFFEDKTSAAAKNFLDTADALRNDYRFAIISDAE